MSSTQELLGMIAALHQRLNEAQDLAKKAIHSPASAFLPPVPSERLNRLVESMQIQNQESIRSLVLQLARAEDGNRAAVSYPSHLTHEAAALLLRIKEILSRLRGNEEYVALGGEEGNEAFRYYHETVLLADILLRLFQTLPDNPASQIRLCEGMRTMAGLLEQRTDNVELMLENRQRQQSWCGDLTSLLVTMAQGKLHDINPIFGLAEDIIAGMAHKQMVDFPTEQPRSLLEMVSQHGLLVAQMIALAGLEDPFWCHRLLQPVVAALVHDVGMVVLDEKLVFQGSRIPNEELAALEKHVERGQEIIGKIQGADKWLLEACRFHHERFNGVGYPGGLRGQQIDPLVGLVSVFDVYIALRSPRPHRGPFDSAGAFAEIMRLNSRGYFDPKAVKLLELFGPYPPGTMVELSNGCTGVVITLPRPARQQETGQPSVLILTDPGNRPFGNRGILDLNWASDIVIVGELKGSPMKGSVPLGGKNWALGA